MIKFIADLCSNHNRNLKRTLKLIDTAKESGCWAVKLQLFEANKLYAPEFKEQITKMKKWEFPYKYLGDISKHCRDIDIKFGCTPFDLTAVDILFPYIDFYKIGSYENRWSDLIKKVIDTKKDWMFSTGMMRLIDVDKFLKYNSTKTNPPKVVFRCNSTYPAKPEECDLSSIRYCSRFMKVNTGWSDHSNEPGVVHKAVYSGAKYIEFHLDLDDKKGFESDIGHCWAPSDIKRVICDVSIGERADFVENQNYDEEAKKWRTDPNDGLRPLKQFRGELSCH